MTIEHGKNTKYKIRIGLSVKILVWQINRIGTYKLIPRGKNKFNRSTVGNFFYL